MPIITVTTSNDVATHISAVQNHLQQTMTRLSENLQNMDPLAVAYDLRFTDKHACNPLNSATPLNFIEHLNQSYTYLISLKAAAYLFAQFPGLGSLNLNLGTTNGADIETGKSSSPSIVAETFAATHAKSNGKLQKDRAKVCSYTADHYYVFYYVHLNPCNLPLLQDELVNDKTVHIVRFATLVN